MRTLLLSVEDHVNFLEVGSGCRLVSSADASGEPLGSPPCIAVRRAVGSGTVMSDNRPPTMPQGRKVRHVQENRRWIDDYRCAACW